jgi:hypothetical protein
MEVAKREGATPYDVKGVEFGHHDKECSFDALVKKHQLDRDPAIVLCKRPAKAVGKPGRRPGPWRTDGAPAPGGGRVGRAGGNGWSLVDGWTGADYGPGPAARSFGGDASASGGAALLAKRAACQRSGKSSPMRSGGWVGNR